MKSLGSEEIATQHEPFLSLLDGKTEPCDVRDR